MAPSSEENCEVFSEVFSVRVLAYAEMTIQDMAPEWRSFQKDFWPQVSILFLRQRVPGRWILALKSVKPLVQPQKISR